MKSNICYTTHKNCNGNFCNIATLNPMKYFKLKYEDGEFEIKKAKSMSDLIDENNLLDEEHCNTRILELSGEQLAIAISNDEFCQSFNS